MNAREVMRRAFRETVGIPEGDYFRSDVFDAQLDALAAAGFVVVACPPGGRVVVDRTEKPCVKCKGTGEAHITRTCPVCGGSGVVEATTIHGLEPAGFFRFVVSDVRGVTGEVTGVSGQWADPSDVPVYRLVALPEETPVSDETVFVVQWAKDYSDHPPVAVFRTEAEAEAWAAPLNDEHEHYWVTEVPLWRAADKE